MQLDPSTLPDLQPLRQRAKALAMLDAIICPEQQYRYFSFDPGFAPNEEMAAMRNGEGDHWYVHLSPFGAAIKGYVHALPRDEARVLAREVRRCMPPAFASFLSQPAFAMDAVSFCFWRPAGGRAWSAVRLPGSGIEDADDASAEFLSILLAPPTCYQEYAEDYFECEAPITSIEHIYRHAPLSAAIVSSLNPQMSLAAAEASAAAIGYPLTAHCASGMAVGGTILAA